LTASIVNNLSVNLVNIVDNMTAQA